MASTLNRPFFSFSMLLIAALVIAGAFFVSQWLVAVLSRLLF